MEAQTWPEEYFTAAKVAGDISAKLLSVFSTTDAAIAEAKDRVVLEFVAGIISSKIDSGIAVDALKTILTGSLKGPEFEAQRIAFLHTIENSLWFWATQTVYDSSAPSEQWKKLAVLTSKLFSCDFFDAASAKLVIPTDLLIYSLNLPDKDEDLNKKFIKIRYVALIQNNLNTFFPLMIIMI